jgi:hypothetical protein
MESNFEKRETIEGQVLSHGDYCEVTREQAVELLTIENEVDAEFYSSIEPVINYVWVNNKDIMLSGTKHGEMKTFITFSELKQRLVNTVKG